MLWVALTILLLSPVVAHIVGRAVASLLSVPNGRIGAWMPTVPDHRVGNGRAAERFERRRRRAENRFLQQFADDGTQQLDATTLAARIDEDIEVAEALLAHLREEVPCRLRVTADGRLLHDFDAASLRVLRDRRRRSLPLRILIAALALFANIGAAWPVIVIGGVGVAALAEMSGAETQGDALETGIAGLAVIIALAVAALLIGWFVQLLLAAFFLDGPDLGERTERENEHPTTDPMVAELYGETSVKKKSWVAGFLAGRGSSSSKSAVSIDVPDGDGIVGCLLIIVVTVLVAIVAGALAVIFLWARGVIRAVRRVGDPEPLMSPAGWIRGASVVDPLERFFPMNDLVLRVYRAIRRAVTHARPYDGALGTRLLDKARVKKHRISALEIQLQEAVDQETAIAIGARLMSSLDGDMVVTDDGEIEFVFPEGSLNRVSGANEQDLGAEYLSLGEKPRRRKSQKKDKLPVNVIGLSWGHLAGAGRLVGGTLLLAIGGLWLAFVDTEGAPAWIPWLGVFLPLLALGTFTLSATARYVAKASAAIGVRRDIRRATTMAIRQHLNRNAEHIDARSLANKLGNVFRPAWGSIQEDMVRAEVEAVAEDLGLEPFLNEANRPFYALQTLVQRRSALTRHRAEQTAETLLDKAMQRGTDDTIVFDSGEQGEQAEAVHALY